MLVFVNPQFDPKDRKFIRCVSIIAIALLVIVLIAAEALAVYMIYQNFAE